jgi:hypothetical protein
MDQTLSSFSFFSLLFKNTLKFLSTFFPNYSKKYLSHISIVNNFKLCKIPLFLKPNFFLFFYFFLNCKIHQYRIEYNNIITYKTSYNLLKFLSTFFPNYSKKYLSHISIVNNFKLCKIPLFSSFIF